MSVLVTDAMSIVYTVCGSDLTFSLWLSNHKWTSHGLSLFCCGLVPINLLFCLAFPLCLIPYTVDLGSEIQSQVVT